MANSLTHIGRLLIENKTKEALEHLRELVRLDHPEKLNEIDLQLSRLSMATQVFAQGLVTLPEHQAEIMKINSGILHLIETLKSALDASTSESKSDTNSDRVALNEYHSYTCDRISHSDAFRDYYGKLGQKRREFFYLYGGDMHSHEGFFRRMAYDLEGSLLDYLNPDLPQSCKALQLEMTFEFSHQLDLYKQNILRSFFSMLGLSPNEHEPILQHDLAYVFAQSPRMAGLSSHDFVCCYIHISEYDWDKTLTTEAARWFINEFCGEKLPPDWPIILFFFAIEYDEENEECKIEVREALQDSTQMNVIPELNMVSVRDLGGWLERYKQLAINTRERKKLLKEHFGDAKEHYMEDVEVKLKKIIDTYNNQL